MTARVQTRPKRVTVEIEMHDGKVIHVELLDDVAVPLSTDMSWERPPVEDTAEMDRTMSSWMIYKPGPRTAITLTASGKQS